MKIGKHEVVFGCHRHVSVYGGMYDYSYDEKEQHWSIPTLQLHGWVTIVSDRDERSLREIERDIRREVEFDLEQREKRKHGISC